LKNDTFKRINLKKYGSIAATRGLGRRLSAFGLGRKNW
jgi:hypothetical protein